MNPPLSHPEEILSQEARKYLRQGGLPRIAQLMEPTSMERRDPGAGWLFDPLLPGKRCLAIREGTRVELLEAGRRSLGHVDPDVASTLLAAGPEVFAVDGIVLERGEAAALPPIAEASERTVSRGASWRRVGDDEEGARLLVFDVLYAGECDVRSVPLMQRRELLRGLLRFSPSVVYVRESSAPGESVFERADREGWPGVVAKRAGSPYVCGRSPDWQVWRRRSD